MTLILLKILRRVRFILLRNVHLLHVTQTKASCHMLSTVSSLIDVVPLSNSRISHAQMGNQQQAKFKKTFPQHMKRKLCFAWGLAKSWQVMYLEKLFELYLMKRQFVKKIAFLIVDPAISVINKNLTVLNLRHVHPFVASLSFQNPLSLPWNYLRKQGASPLCICQPLCESG